MADWTARLIAAAGGERAALVGHSMGALVALETAARHPDRVARMALLGAAAKMPVHPDLLAAAKANSSRRHRHGEPVGPRRRPPLWEAPGRPASGCSAAPSACWKKPRRAFSMPTSPRATPMRSGTGGGGEGSLRDDVDSGRTRPDDAAEIRTGARRSDPRIARRGLVAHRASADVRVAARR